MRSVEAKGVAPALNGGETANTEALVFSLSELRLTGLNALKEVSGLA
jgi:hypothetical protein